MQLSAGDADTREAAFCRSSGSRESLDARVIIAILVLLLALPSLMYSVFVFSKKIQLFPLKARGPRLVLLQMIYFVLLNMIPLIVEVLLASNITWENPSNPNKTYISRRFLKAFYFLTRVSVNLIYVHRTLLIYANWKVPLDSLYNKFWTVFGNETRSLIVN